MPSAAAAVQDLVSLLRGALRSVRRRLRRQAQFATVGRYRICLPRGSILNEIQQRYKRYDVALGEIASVIAAKYPNLRAIDIGANVGDTASLIRRYADIPVLCVEGDPVLMPLLRRNAATLGDGIVIEPSFVGPEGTWVDLSKATALGVNASLVGALAGNAGERSTRLRRLESILDDHHDFSAAKLVKIDAEGFDFDIVSHSTSFLGRAKPAVFFEYQPSLRPYEPQAGVEAIETLQQLGYTAFLYYDNFGNFLIRLRDTDRDKVVDLNSYLEANHRFGTVVHYFDICAFHEEDVDLAEEIRKREIAAIKPRAT